MVKLYKVVRLADINAGIYIPYQQDDLINLIRVYRLDELNERVHDKEFREFVVNSYANNSIIYIDNKIYLKGRILWCDVIMRNG